MSRDVTFYDRAVEISQFLGISEREALATLSLGFPAMHARVAEDFRRANPTNDDELLRWYRTTDAYIWELSAYHADPGFNYAGMCEGVAIHLQRESVGRKILALGDGIGDLTRVLVEYGLNAVYHDLDGCRTAAFAESRLLAWLGRPVQQQMTESWQPHFPIVAYDAVVSLDFFEHLPNVRVWVQELYHSLVPGGLFLAQNAFAIGSGSDGSIPCHLSANDHYEKDWDPLLETVGFRRDVGGWWRHP